MKNKEVDAAFLEWWKNRSDEYVPILTKDFAGMAWKAAIDWYKNKPHQKDIDELLKE
jgi:hypothetical protein